MSKNQRCKSIVKIGHGCGWSVRMPHWNWCKALRPCKISEPQVYECSLITFLMENRLMIQRQEHPEEAIAIVQRIQGKLQWWEGGKRHVPEMFSPKDPMISLFQAREN